MAISEKTRKLLWGSSGNRCAICRRILVVDGDGLSDASVIGDECHIVARSMDGPRADPAFPAEKLHEVENLILLCRVHHKIVDDQVVSYPVERLRDLKEFHERWVEDTLSSQLTSPRIVRAQSARPQFLDRVTSGQVLLMTATACITTCPQVAENIGNELEDVIADFLQNLYDYRDVWDFTGVANQLKAYRFFSKELANLEVLGCGVYIGTEDAKLEGGVGSPSNWKILHIAFQGPES